MNDDQIRSELERRAGSAASAPDWTKRALLPAVWHEIDARPQPVVTSRWPSFAGAAALTVALLILVVAIPRLGPQLPSSTSSPSGTPHGEPTPAPSILTTSDFASRLAAGDLAGRTVLVDGSINVSTRRGPMCVPYDPPHHCFLGTLEGVEPPIDIWARMFPTTESDSGATWDGPGVDWSWWTGPDAVSGILVLSVAENDQVDFLGPVRQSESGLSWTVAEATELAIESVEPEQVILVDGWLVATSATVNVRFCPPIGVGDLQGLPSRFCGGTDSLQSGPPDSRVVPADPYIWVQQDAAEQYGEGPGLYAVSPRLYGGGCDDQPPCWLWDVVARVDDPPTAVAPTPEITPSPSPVGDVLDCPPTWHTSPDDVPVNALHATVLDQTGLVIGCEKPDDLLFDWRQDSPLRIGNPGDDLTLLQVEWSGNPCSAAREYTLRRDGDGYVLEGRSTYDREDCILPLVIHSIRLTLSEPIDASTVVFEWNSTAPVATPSPTHKSVTRTVACAASEGLAYPPLTLLDHSGLVAGCAMHQALWTPDGFMGVDALADPNQLAVSWVVPSSGCDPGDRLEFWGPVEGRPGGDDYVLLLGRPEFDITCDVMQTRRVDLTFAEPMQPTEIKAVAVTESADGTTSSFDASGSGFQLRLEAPAGGLVANTPLDVSSTLTYSGEDPVTLSGWWQPDFGFTSLTGGPSFSYGSLLICPDAEMEMSYDDSLVGRLQGPNEPSPEDPNYPYLSEYAYDGQFRLPAGTYLISNGVAFNVGPDCTGDSVQLQTSIVIRIE